MKKLNFEQVKVLNNLGGKDQEICEMAIDGLAFVSDIHGHVWILAENCTQKSGKVLIDEYGWTLYSEGFVNEAQNVYPNEKDVKKIFELAHTKYIERLVFKNLNVIARNCIRNIVNEKNLPISEEDIFDIEIKSLLDRDRMDFIEENIKDFLVEKAEELFEEKEFDGEFNEFDFELEDFIGVTIEETVFKIIKNNK